MVSIVDDVGAMLVPGTTHAEIFERALELHRERGVEQLARFTHTGHNIGLETEERWLADSPDETIEPGMAINIELYTTLETGTARSATRRHTSISARRPRSPDRAPAGDPGGPVDLGSAAARFGSGSSDSGSSARPTWTDTSRRRAAELAVVCDLSEEKVDGGFGRSRGPRDDRLRMR